MQQPEAQLAQPIWKEGPYSIKRHGTTLDHCEAEPIHTPGCIQAHGVLLVLRPSDLTILQVSENSEAWLGMPPEDLLGCSVSVALGADGQARLREYLVNESLEKSHSRFFAAIPFRARAPFPVLSLRLT